MDATQPQQDPPVDPRFDGVRRLYGDAAWPKIQAARIAVVGQGRLQGHQRCGGAHAIPNQPNSAKAQNCGMN